MNKPLRLHETELLATNTFTIYRPGEVKALYSAWPESPDSHCKLNGISATLTRIDQSFTSPCPPSVADEELEAINASIREDEEKGDADENAPADDDDDDEREELIRRELGDSDDEQNFDVVDKESTFDLAAFLMRFMHPKVMHALT